MKDVLASITLNLSLSVNEDISNNNCSPVCRYLTNESEIIFNALLLKQLSQIIT